MNTLSGAELARRAAHCVTHHDACDCREWAMRQVLGTALVPLAALDMMAHDNDTVVPELQAAIHEAVRTVSASLGVEYDRARLTAEVTEEIRAWTTSGTMPATA